MKKIKVIIIYALPHIQYLKKITIAPGSTVEFALIQSNIIKVEKKINIYKNKIGIYGTITNLKHILKDGDQIEIYRDLIMDPKELRRNKINVKKY
ncbi:MAG TPA: RnfH family protein [Buchnera sp. (in: enterobacteria)]|nr:RnfH family protein [Buchnera sp. (in: enterobacteria)]